MSNRLSSPSPEDLTLEVRRDKKIVVSLLFFYKAEISLRCLQTLFDTGRQYTKRRTDVSLYIICRNNAPDDNIASIEDFVRTSAGVDGLEIHLTTSDFNLGFGAGHNANLLSEAAADAGYFLLLNNDIAFPNLDFIDEMLHVFETNEKVGAIGALESPGDIDSLSATVKPTPALPPIVDYAEASFLMVRAGAFRSVGGFRSEMAYAYYEDADLSLRLRQQGWAIEFVNAPHQHFRGSSAALLPASHYHFLHESNRAFFLSRWNGYLRHRAITSRAYVDLSADGVGDIVFSFGPFCSFLREARAGNVEVTVGLKGRKMRFLFEMLDVTILDVTDYDSPQAIELMNFDTCLYPARVVHSAPFHSQQLIAAALNLHKFDSVSSELTSHYRSETARQRREKLIGDATVAKGYAVVHLDSQRQTFEGRAVPFLLMHDALELLAARLPIVLVGMRTLGTDDPEADVLDRFVKKHGIVDLRDSPIEDIFLAIAGASRFVGIDSGPMHIAQQFEVPSFIIFGATHSLTKVIDKNLSYVVTHPDLDCLGCYHYLFQPAYSFCLRRDQACVRALDNTYIAEHMRRFLADEPCDWEPQERRLAELQTRWLAQQIHHPAMRNTLVHVHNMQDMRLLGEVSAFVLGKIEEVAKERLASNDRRYRDSISRLKEREATLANRSARLEQELKRVQTGPGFISAMARSIFSPSEPADKKVIMDLGVKANFEKMTVNVRVERTPDGVVFNCRMDPMLLLPRLDVPAGRDIKIELELDTLMDVPIQVFWAKKQGAFTEEASVRRALRYDLGKVDVLLKPNFSPIYLRIDPGDGGERYVFKSLRVLA